MPASGPYVLVGHFYGCQLVRIYAYRFPNQVTGMVLAATSYPDVEIGLDQSAQEARDARIFRYYYWSTRLGQLRMAPERFYPAIFRQYIALLRTYLPAQAARTEIEFLFQTGHVNAMLPEEENILCKIDIADAACARGFGTYHW